MALTTRIFLLRHAETEWNEQKRLQGNQDSALTERGRAQANALRQALQQLHFDRAYVSPLLRARETLRILLQGRDIETVVADNLAEIKLGPWEGKTLSEAERSHPLEYDAFWNQPDSFNLAGAETFQQLQRRVVAELESVFATEKHNSIVIVSHWIAIKVALAHYSSIPLSGLSSVANPQNGGYLCLCREGARVSIETH